MSRLASLALAAAFVSGLSLTARAERAGPVDTFDIDVLTASRYGLNQDWAPASCFGRRICPEDHRDSARHGDPLPGDVFGF